MRIIETKVYTFDELKDSAKEVAREWYRQGNDMPDLEESMKEELNSQLEKMGYNVKKLKVFYSLSYSQGDGASFEALLERNGSEWQTVKISHQYEHENTMTGYRIDESGEQADDEIFTSTMRKLARDLARYGYEWIEYENSPEHVDEEILQNEYTFTESGKRFG